MRYAYLFLVLCACKTETVPARAPVTTAPAPELNLPAEHPDLSALSVRSRGPRRMSVSQLEDSIGRIMDRPTGTIELLQAFRAAMGQQDYLRVTEESLEPSPLFMKFMMDLGGAVCETIREEDLPKAQNERVLVRFQDPDQNLDYLLLRFLSLSGEDVAAYKPDLQAVFELGQQGARGVDDGWQAVCVALFTSAEMLLY